MKIILIILTSFSLGFASSFLFNPKKSNVNNETTYIKPEFHNHSDHEKETQEVLDKAKEFYEKSFKLFLISIGHKLTASQTKSLSSLIEDPQDFVQENKSVDFPPIEKNIKVNETEVFTNESLFAFNPNNSQEIIQGLKEFQDFDHYDKIRESLNNILKDPAVFHAKSKFTKDIKKLERVNGQYFGKLYRLTGEHKGKIDIIDLNVQFYFIEGENRVDGNFSLKLTRDGEVYSNSQGRGGNGDIRIRKGQVLIDAGPNRFFHFRSKNMKVANFYEDGKLTGTAMFNKK